ncbi:hypothetical protein GCM10007424_03180 [Flavobacterium suaedae]|uniref:Lipoprotein n=1 Tax=Flavobacterium suaedae TaxID=1767027 RepID=A0ABQ1JER4_9FLAO|nr:hypothetical protein [Flavobacterium suaedae]GGB66572.1 hypothetical protein GCM10007424_03180 [Flavobacterium suaedae]
MKKIAFILLAGICFTACKEEKKNEEDKMGTPETVTHEEVMSEKSCYLKVSEFSPEYNKDRIINDSIVLQFERTGDSIYGELNWLPYEKDSKYTTFKGIVNGNKASTIAHSIAEGDDYKEELNFTLEGDKAKVMYGEMVEGDNGVWKYKDVNTTSEQVLEKVPCE